MKNIFAIVALTAFAIGVVSSASGSKPAQSTAAAVAITTQAKADIAELPIPTAAKVAFVNRLDGCTQTQVAAIVDEARHSVDIPFGSRVEGHNGIPGALITPDGNRIPLS